MRSVIFYEAQKKKMIIILIKSNLVSAMYTGEKKKLHAARNLKKKKKERELELKTYPLSRLLHQ